MMKVWAFVLLLSFSFNGFSDPLLPAQPAPALACADALQTTQAPPVNIVVEGAGDVTERFYIPALHTVVVDHPQVRVTFCDFSRADEAPEQKEKRLRIKAKIEAMGFTYLDKRFPEDEKKYKDLQADYVVFAVAGALHQPLMQSWRAKAHPPQQIFLEKPIDKSTEGAKNLLDQLDAFDNSVMALDHYRPKLVRQAGHVERDLNFLGGAIKDLRFVILENRSGSDPNAGALMTPSLRDGAIERENRVQVMKEGVAADLLPHMFAVLEYYGISATARPLDVWAGRYRGVDGDPNKATEIPKETFFAANFVFQDKEGRHVNGQVIVGKGVRTLKFGPSNEHEAKFLVLKGINGREIQFNLKSNGEGSALDTYFDENGRVLERGKLERNPYHAFFEALATGNSIAEGHSVHIEEAVHFREKMEHFTRKIEGPETLPLYDGGMGGEHPRSAPLAEDLMRELPIVAGPHARAPNALPDVPVDRDILMIGGVGVMGKGFSHRLSDVADLKVVISDPNPRAQEIIGTMGKSENVKLAPNLREAVASLKKPRKMILLVASDRVFEMVLKELEGVLDPGDIVIDAGNSDWKITGRHQAEFKNKGVHLLGMGVSGGERGAWNGSAMMLGGDKQAWEQVRPTLEKIAGQIPDLNDPARQLPSVVRVGPGGSGHFVKMAHNGIEYGEMQLMAETYDLLRKVAGLSTAEIHGLLHEWDETNLHSFLLQATVQVLSRTDAQTGRPLVEMVKPTVEQKGTGKWATENALELGVYAPALGDAVFERFASALYDQREKYNDLAGPPAVAPLKGRALEDFLRVLPRALYAARVLVYAQGLELIRAASDKYFASEVSLGETTKVWRTGSILQGPMLDSINKAFTEDPNLKAIMDSPAFRQRLSELQVNLRDLIHDFAGPRGVRTPGFSNALAYYDAHRTAGANPANLLAAVRDYFGGHTYRRVDEVDGPAHHDRWGD